MKVMIIGADGQLGTDLVRVFQSETNWEIIPTTIRDFDITQADQCERMITTHSPDVLINTAAYIQVDLCEKELETAFRVNVFSQKHLTDLCRQNKVRYCLLSTDYVFDGGKGTPYTEEDIPNPANMYGVSKLAGEQVVRYNMDSYFIVRVSGLYGVAGPMGKRGNFVDTILERARKGEPLRVVDDQCLTPTYTLDVAKQLVSLLSTSHFGLYHITNQGACTWHAFAEEALRQCGLKNEVGKAKTGDFGELARRPAYSVLENKHLQQLGLDQMPDWKDALHHYLVSKGHIQ